VTCGPPFPFRPKGRRVIAEFLQWMGYGLCHQLPERSFFGGGVQVPVCARDTGIYIGFVVSMAVVALVHRGERPRGFPKWPVWALMGAMVTLMAWDGVTSYAGMRVTSNELRLFTGLGTGFSAAVVVFPMLQDELWVRSGRGRVLDPVWRLAVWCAAVPATYALIWWAAPLFGVLYPVVVALCIVFTLSAINLVMVAMLPAFDRKAASFSAILVPAAIAVALSFAEMAVAGYLRASLDALARRL